ncbi:MAG: tetratricopeptide repeat protein [Planctomycetes bacterium]|nr:tetratricopeptide repeat protein [Planctomycetota bacterium]
MRSRKPPSQAAPASLTAASPSSRNWKRLLALVVVLVVCGLAWVAWSVLRPDPLQPAREALDRRDFQTAMTFLSASLNENPDDTEANLLAAQTARRAGDFAVAFERLKISERKSGRTEPLTQEYSLIKVQQGDAAEADAQFVRHIDRPELAETPLVMEAYLEGRLRVLAPRSDSEMNAQKAEVAGVAKLHRAVDLWLRLRTGKADTVQGLVWRGRIQVFENEHTKGIASLREALELDPNHFEARWHLAMAVAQDSPPEAARHLETLLAREPESYLIRFGLARTYRMLGRTQDSQRLLTELRAARPNDPSVLLELANLALDAGKVEEATPLVTRMLELAPDALPVILTASRYHQLANHPDEAERYRKRAESMLADQQKKLESSPTQP